MKKYAVADTPLMTVQEYVEFEERSELRHEFIDNQLIAMPGTTSFHNDICINLTQLLKSLLKGRGVFKIHQENVKVQIESERDYTYPDVMVLSDPRDFDSPYIKKFPLVIIEVMSKSSRLEDSTDKFIRYKNIESLRDYILVDSEKPFVEVRHRADSGEWESGAYLPADGLFRLPSLGLELPFEAVYEGVF
jgi:Uncharacterized protein conserved in cyanobacteria